MRCSLDFAQNLPEWPLVQQNPSKNARTERSNQLPTKPAELAPVELRTTSKLLHQIELRSAAQLHTCSHCGLGRATWPRVFSRDLCADRATYTWELQQSSPHDTSAAPSSFTAKYGLGCAAEKLYAPKLSFRSETANCSHVSCLFGYSNANKNAALLRTKVQVRISRVRALG